MGVTKEEHTFVKEFERRQLADYAVLQNRIRKKPLLETLSNPSSLVRAVLILPLPWVCLYTVVQLSQQKQDELRPFCFLGAFLVGYFLADLVSGLVHLWFDMFPLRMRQNKTIMEAIAWGFQRHHAVQQNWLHDDIFESGILTSGFLAFPLCLLYLFLYRVGMVTSPYPAFAWTVFLTTCLHVQLFHAVAHNTFKGGPPLLQAVLHWLMSTGLILDCKTHHLHHTQFDCNFGIVNGWSNCLVNPLYKYLERNGYIDPAMQGSSQREVYIHKKVELLEPYCRMYPDYRAYQERMQQHGKR